MDVTIWTRLMTIPAMKPTVSNGRLNQNVVMRASRNTWMASCWFISVEALHQRPNHQIPSVYQHEQQDLKGSRDHDRRELDHADGESDRRDHEIDHQERQE